MHKDTILTPLEPFTPEEESALFDKLDLLSVAELENYIGLAQNSLRHKGLEPSWRPRVEIGLQRAEIVLVREAAAAALKAEAAKAEALEPEVATPAKAKAKAKSKSKKAAAAVATVADADDVDDESAAAADDE